MSPRRPAALTLMSVAFALTACGEVVSSTFSSVGDSLDSTPIAASLAPEGDATLTIVNVGGVVDGPGMSIADALASASGEPTLVNGTVLMDLDGTIWLCEALAESSPPTCGEPRLRILNYPEGTADWDIETGDLIGLQEDGGVLWREGAQFFGIVAPAT
jgi:hypothetical protein